MNSFDPGSDLAQQPGAVRVRKRGLPVEATFARAAGTVATREGLVPYVAGDAILTGVEGERWPVERAVFAARYRPVGGTKWGDDGRYVARAETIWAVRISADQAPISVKLSSGGVLVGQAGDWLVQYAPDDVGVVGSGVFSKTYRVVEEP